MRVGIPREDRVYEEVGGDQARLASLLASYLDEYNMEHNTPMQLGTSVVAVAANGMLADISQCVLSMRVACWNMAYLNMYVFT